MFFFPFGGFLTNKKDQEKCIPFYCRASTCLQYDTQMIKYQTNGKIPKGIIHGNE